MIINRVNAIGLQYVLSSNSDGTTSIRLIGPGDKRITVKASIDDMNQAWFNWQMGGQYVQNAFSFLSPGEREFLMSGLLDEEFKELFKEGDDEL